MRTVSAVDAVVAPFIVKLYTLRSRSRIRASKSSTRMSVVMSITNATSIRSTAVASDGATAAVYSLLSPDIASSSNASSSDIVRDVNPKLEPNLSFVTHENKSDDDDNDDDNIKRENTKSKRTDGNDSKFYDNWVTGNWCWERKYDGNLNVQKIKKQAEDVEKIAARIGNCNDDGGGSETLSRVASRRDSDRCTRMKKRPRLNKAIDVALNGKRSKSNAKDDRFFDDWVEGNWCWLNDQGVTYRHKKFREK